MTDPAAHLVERARAGDSDAVAQLWREHRAWVAAALLAHAPRGAEIEDLLQDVAVVFVREIKHLREAPMLRAWLRTIAVNSAVSAGRRRAARGKVDALEDDAADRRGAMRAAIESDLDDILERVSRLSPELREPLLLQSVRGLSQREISQILSVPETTVETRLARARRQLREQARIPQKP